MRFLLYNIRYATGEGTRFHLPFPYAGYLRHSSRNLDRIIGFLKEEQPDIVGLVEVDSGSFRMHHQCQAEVISERLGHYHLVESKYGNGSVAQRLPVMKQQGNAVLARTPILDHSFHYFQKGVKRLVIEARLQQVTVFLVHLSLTYRNRQYQLERLYNILRGVDGPVILAGDFNVLQGDRELGLFLGATGLVNANRERQPSFPAAAPNRQLDFILHSRHLEVRNFRVPSVRFSDHVPMICDFEFCD
ncbi:MAG: endonuclease [Desulfobulbus propionicus]|nr:MAG: endonuclease [Desulfobulbus propionicus]